MCPTNTDERPDLRASELSNSEPHHATTDGLADDLLRGAEAISEFLFGDKILRRKVYHLAETSRLPVFRLGSVLCARRSVLIAWIAEQEQRARQYGAKR